MEATIENHLPGLRASQVKGLTLWVYGTILARSGCQNAVVTALAFLGHGDSIRQYLREWLYDGQDRARPCQTAVDVGVCFAPLLRWVLAWWQSDKLALAIDPTLKGDRICALVISVVYRSCAIPVAWHMLSANRTGPWIDPVVALLRALAPAVPPHMTVLVLCDRGLRSPRLWKQIRALGWHPYMRQSRNTVFCPDGGVRRPARTLVPGPGYAWIGSGTAFRQAHIRRRGTLLVVWEYGQKEPWVVLTDLPPPDAGVCWYGLRCWIEAGFRALKSMGWHWQHTRRTDPRRVARHWLVLAVATLWTLAYGTRVEDAQAQNIAPSRLRAPPTSCAPAQRSVSVLRQGLAWLNRLLPKGRLWRRVWLLPEPWPEPAPHLTLIYHPDT